MADKLQKDQGIIETAQESNLEAFQRTITKGSKAPPQGHLVASKECEDTLFFFFY